MFIRLKKRPQVQKKQLKKTIALIHQKIKELDFKELQKQKRYYMKAFMF